MGNEVRTGGEEIRGYKVVPFGEEFGQREGFNLWADTSRQGEMKRKVGRTAKAC